MSRTTIPASSNRAQSKALDLEERLADLPPRLHPPPFVGGRRRTAASWASESVSRVLCVAQSLCSTGLTVGKHSAFASPTV